MLELKAVLLVTARRFAFREAYGEVGKMRGGRTDGLFLRRWRIGVGGRIWCHWRVIGRRMGGLKRGRWMCNCITELEFGS